MIRRNADAISRRSARNRAFTAISQTTAPAPSPSMKYINCDELAGIIKGDKVMGKDFVVVDVRDDDYMGGNNRGSINRPSSEFLMTVDGLVRDTKDIPLVIFHCTLSQIRGPKAARIYEETRRNALQDGDIPHEVAVLRDGFSQFQAKFKDDPSLVENWDESNALEEIPRTTPIPAPLAIPPNKLFPRGRDLTWKTSTRKLPVGGGSLEGGGGIEDALVESDDDMVGVTGT
ncbi:putative rhodanese Homology domain containing protein [Lyophyllum shimeji]|uniref:Rhodanese Homology domain containing protein n=1 Tax=Lyophyllum shimeji TaxID=47721 RepID=A0A9P3PLP8_LYOSH|nr:putative rhodanese Homology domain containing protein [Lyophyllum shimeji]